MTKELIRVVRDKDLRKYRHASDALQILYECPGAYITAPLLISALMEITICNDSYITEYNSMEVWFQSEGSKRAEFRYLARPEIGAPDNVLPKSIGFTAGCVWLELYYNNSIAIYGTPDGKRDLKNSVFDLCPEADPIVGIMNFTDFQRYSSPFSYSDNSLQRIGQSIEKWSLGPFSSTTIPRNEKGSVLGTHQEIAAALEESMSKFDIVSQFVPNEARLPVFATFMKHNLQCLKYSRITLKDLKSKQKEVDTMCEDRKCFWMRDDFMSRTNKCTNIIPAFEGLHDIHMPFSRSLSLDILLTMIFQHKNNEREALCVLNFVEGIASLPDDDRPSMWDIYMSWKNGCEHWELGPVLAAPFIERIPGSRGYFEIQDNVLAR